jgi:hypothetical protein
MSTQIGADLIHEDPLWRLRMADIGAAGGPFKSQNAMDVHLARSRVRLYR